MQKKLQNQKDLATSRMLSYVHKYSKKFIACIYIFIFFSIL